VRIVLSSFVLEIISVITMRLGIAYWIAAVSGAALVTAQSDGTEKDTSKLMVHVSSEKTRGICHRKRGCGSGIYNANYFDGFLLFFHGSCYPILSLLQQ
jgi:hypothetical protein